MNFDPPPFVTSTRYIVKLFGVIFFATAFYILVFTDFENNMDAESEESGNGELESAHVALPRKVRSYVNETAVATTPTRPPKKKAKKILAWTTVFGHDLLIYDMHKIVNSKKAFSQCPGRYTDCEWTIARNEIKEADAVVFHFFPGDFSLTDLPTYRNPSQRWVHFNLEPPHRFQGKF